MNLHFYNFFLLLQHFSPRRFFASGSEWKFEAISSSEIPPTVAVCKSIEKFSSRPRLRPWISRLKPLPLQRLPLALHLTHNSFCTLFVFNKRKLASLMQKRSTLLAFRANNISQSWFFQLRDTLPIVFRCSLPC